MFTEKYAGLSSGLKTNLVSWYDLGSTSLGSNLVASWNNSPYPWDNWTTSGADITQFDCDGSLPYAHSNTIPFVSGKLYKLVIVLDHTSGSLPVVMIADTNGANAESGTSGGFTFSGTELVDGTNTFIFESSFGTKRLNLQENSESVNNLMMAVSTVQQSIQDTHHHHTE